MGATLKFGVDVFEMNFLWMVCAMSMGLNMKTINITCGVLLCIHEWKIGRLGLVVSKTGKGIIQEDIVRSYMVYFR